MNHLRNLYIINLIFAILIGLGGIVGVIAGLLPIFAGGGGDAILISIITVVVVVVICFGLALFMFMTGKRVAEGSWRIPQTILAVLNVTNVPIGTAYGVYALWVCWMNEETKNMFR